jgi:DNA (cytosine-5)-methyltransferase 1
MTPREYARLQGVPDQFDYGDDTNSALFGFGDAVCVPAIRWVAEQAFRGVFEPSVLAAHG